jgi:hypothetical protein
LAKPDQFNFTGILNMRTKPLIIAAAALLAATPALAQNDAVNAPANVTEANTADMNATANIAANVPTPAEPVALPGDNAMNAAAPAPEPKKSFPWGLIGILGLLGLIPRTRR